MSKPLAILTSTVCALVLAASLVFAGELSGYEFFTLTEGNVPGTPASGDWTLYATSSGLTVKDDTGATVTLGAGGGGGFTVGLGAGGVASINSTTFPAFTTTATLGLAGYTFDGATREAIQWTLTLPDSYDSSSPLEFEAVIHSGSTSQGVRFGVRIGSLEATDVTTAPGTILDTIQLVDATTSGSIDTTTTISISIDNSDMDNASAGDLILLQLERVAAAAEDPSNVDVTAAESRIFQ